jgi:hypothetical protein
MKIIKILKILEPYMTDYQKEYPFWTDHDILGFNIDPESIQKVHLEELEELGVYYSKEYESLIMFT